MQRLNKGAQKTTPFYRLVPTSKTVRGVNKKTYESDGILRFCNFSTYGGTETKVNDVVTVEDTAQIVAWYYPDITSGDHIKILTTGAEYEIIGEPENIELRNLEMTFKVRRYKGGA